MQTLIIGGGLSGLALANTLESNHHDYMLVEARDRFGGRIMTEYLGRGYFDMGPAWFWPGQPRIAALIDRLGLEKFDQFASGSLIHEDEQGQIQRGRGYASVEGPWRVKGGFGALTRSLVDRIPGTRKCLNSLVTDLKKTGEGITATICNGDTLTADQVVLALPPRVAAEIGFTPYLPTSAIQSMKNVPTWMASQAKALAVYDTPFWREAGLSGDAMSRFGPMVEIHDASPETGGPFALFGFIGLPPQARTDERVLRHHLIAQLERLFGVQAAHPTKLYVKDWAFDPHTSTEADMHPLHSHPTYVMPAALEELWGKRLRFAGTEIAPQFGGYVEGALEAAEYVAKDLDVQKAGHDHA